MSMHRELFPDATLFHRIASTVCRAGVLPRKELYEAWETARRVRRRFRGGGRVVDLACGHGLLAQIMLILDQTSPLALAVDAVRAIRLRVAGYEIYTAAIPAAITPKNRLLMGAPCFPARYVRWPIHQLVPERLTWAFPLEWPSPWPTKQPKMAAGVGLWRFFSMIIQLFEFSESEKIFDSSSILNLILHKM